MQRFNTALIVIVLIAFIVRLYQITTPLADWHSFRQADTASVTREYLKHGIDLLHPRYHDLSNIQSGTRVNGADNVNGWRMVEFPIVNALIAISLRTFPSADLVVVSRLFSILASLVSLIGIAYIGKYLFSNRVGLFSALFFALNPYTIYYSRVILPEPYLVLGIVSALFFLILYEREMKAQKAIIVFSKRTFILAFAFGLSLAMTLLIKPMGIFYIPFFAAIVWVERGWAGLFDPLLLFMGASSTIPILMWRSWIENFPAGIPASDWLFNGNGIRLRPAWFRWLFWERLTKLILGYAGVIFVLPLFLKGFESIKKSVFTLIGGGIGILLYFVVFATGNVQHDYYQVLLTPYIALVIGFGIDWLWNLNLRYIKKIVVIAFVLSIFFSWRQIKGYYNINNWAIVHAGQEADRILPRDAKVIAPYQGDTAFLFQINRTGWPIGFDIDKKLAEGAQYYVSVNYDDEARTLEKKYQTVKKTDEYIIINLQQKNEE